MFPIPRQEQRSSSGDSDRKDCLQLHGIKKGFIEEAHKGISSTLTQGDGKKNIPGGETG